MAPTIAGGSVGARILMLLGERYPITLDQVALALRLRPDVATREVKRLAAQGLVTLEKLGEATYVALTGTGITYLGLPAKERARLEARRLPPARPKDEDDPAFG